MTKQHLVLTALRSAGYRIDDADLVAMSHKNKSAIYGYLHIEVGVDVVDPSDTEYARRMVSGSGADEGNRGH